MQQDTDTIAENAPKRGRPVQMEPAEREAMILDCAIALFSERGPEDVTMADIANGTGMSKRTLYAFYPSREAMVAACLERIAGSLFRPLRPDEQSATLEERLRILLTFDAKLDSGAVPLELLRIVISEARNFPETARRLSQKGPMQVSGLLRNELFRAAGRGEIAIPPDQIPQAADLLVDMVVGNIIPGLLDPEGHSPGQDERANRRDLAIWIFLEGVRPRDPDACLRVTSTCNTPDDNQRGH